MRTRLGVELWQAVLLYLLPPLLIGLAVVWYGVRRVTVQRSGDSPSRKRKKKARHERRSAEN